MLDVNNIKLHLVTDQVACVPKEEQMGFEIKNVKGDVSPQMIELAQAVVAACEERGFFLESFVVKPMEGGESED